MKLIKADISNVRVESSRATGGVPSEMWWNVNSILHLIATIDEQPSGEFGEQYGFWCTIKRNGRLATSKEVVYRGANKGCPNPCRMYQVVGDDDMMAVFTVKFLEPGQYIGYIGNERLAGNTVRFEIR